MSRCWSSIGATLRRSTHAFESSYRQQFEADNPNRTDAEFETGVQQWRTDMNKQIERKLRALSRKDKDSIRGLQRLKWLQYEPDLQQEISYMLESPGKFRVADLGLADKSYLRMFIQDKIDILSKLRIADSSANRRAVPAQALSVRVPVRASPDRERWKNMTSQVQAGQALAVERPEEVDVNAISDEMLEAVENS